MVRKLKYHEKKLLKKVDFISWEVDNNIHEVKILRKYHIQKRDDYTKYNKLSRNVREIVRKIKDLDGKDPFRTEATEEILEKLYVMGLIPSKKNLELADSVTASSFCRRRLPVVMVRTNMTENLRTATQFIQQGQLIDGKYHECRETDDVRIGPEVVMDPAFLVTRNMEDFITWVDTSAIRKHVAQYNEMRDDFDLL